MKPAARYFIAIAIITIIGLTAGSLTYGEPYHFFSYPLSFIGYVNTYPAGVTNTVARLFFSSTLVLDGLALLGLANYWRRNRAGWSAIVTTMSGLGLIMAAFSPDDVAHARHVFSTAIAVGGLWLLAAMTIKKFWQHIIVQLPLLIYAVIYCWFDYSWYPAAWQKISLFLLIGGLIAALSKASPEDAI